MTNDLDMPARIAALPRDHRGYPVPFVVLVEADGRPDFVVNDTAKVFQAARDRLCAICGEALELYPWFVGGPGNALLNGAEAVYIDGPMHRECMTFALRVCPHLAHRLTKPVQLQAVTARLAGQGIQTVDNTVIAGVPPVFVAIQAWAYAVGLNGADALIYHVRKPYRKTEYWRAGAMLPRDEGERIAKAHARKVAQELKR